MLRLLVISAVIVSTLAGVIHDDYAHDGASETGHHHEIEHKHATSHQSFKVHHYHPVPVYVKKEDQHLLKHPVEISGVKHKLKVLHPETQHSHGHGLTLENHSEFEDKTLHGHGGYNHEAPAASYHEGSYSEGGAGGDYSGHYGGGGGEDYSSHYSSDSGDGGHEYHDINVGHHHE
ncbi:histidine-rich glycoprotein [Sergentomyia squamirostris]